MGRLPRCNYSMGRGYLGNGNPQSNKMWLAYIFSSSLIRSNVCSFSNIATETQQLCLVCTNMLKPPIAVIGTTPIDGGPNGKTCRSIVLLILCLLMLKVHMHGMFLWLYVSVPATLSCYTTSHALILPCRQHQSKIICIIWAKCTYIISCC